MIAICLQKEGAMRWIFCSAAAVLMLAASSTGAFAYCTDRDAVNSRNVVYNIGTWRDLYKFYKKYGECDDSAASEGLSDRVPDLLARHWDTVGVMQEYVEDSPEFFDFILLHIDTLMRPDQANKILDNVRNRCPSGSEAMCSKIGAEVEKMLPRLWGNQN
jgi:hypothetical protein